MICPSFNADSPSAIATALRSVDCMAGEATATAFSRLFGTSGLFTAALTILLTLYVAFFAIGLLTGRTSLSLSALTPRMMGLGLALTFATSWVAYSQVIWTLLAAGPDSIAAALLGVKGSASQAFAARLDLIFGAVVDAATQAQQTAKDDKGTTPADLLSYAALLLLLGTVGVLVTSRIALGVVVALGPVFLILALFPGTRGLFEGWLRTAVTFALVPLFAVLIGVGSIAMLDPVVAGLAGGEVDLRQAAVVFVVTAIHCALMALAMRLVTGLTTGWRIPFATTVPVRERAAPSVDARAYIDAVPLPAPFLAGSSPAPDERIRAVVAAGVTAAGDRSELAETRTIHLAGAATTPSAALASPLPPPQARAQNLGRTLRALPSQSPLKETPA